MTQIWVSISAQVSRTGQIFCIAAPCLVRFHQLTNHIVIANCPTETIVLAFDFSRCQHEVVAKASAILDLTLALEVLVRLDNERFE